MKTCFTFRNPCFTFRCRRQRPQRNQTQALDLAPSLESSPRRSRCRQRSPNPSRSPRSRGVRHTRTAATQSLSGRRSRCAADWQRSSKTSCRACEGTRRFSLQRTHRGRLPGCARVRAVASCVARCAPAPPRRCAHCGLILERALRALGRFGSAFEGRGACNLPKDGNC